MSSAIGIMCILSVCEMQYLTWAVLNIYHEDYIMGFLSRILGPDGCLLIVVACRFCIYSSKTE